METRYLGGLRIHEVKKVSQSSRQIDNFFVLIITVVDSNNTAFDISLYSDKELSIKKGGA